MIRNLKKIIRYLSRGSAFLVTVLLLAVIGILYWFISAGFSPDNERIVIGIAAVSACFSAISAIFTLVQAVETQKQRENLERPYIIAYFDGSSSGALSFVIENYGNSPAKNVTFEFCPPPIDHAGRKLNEISLFSNPISFLPKGQIIRQIIDSSFNFLDEGKPLKYIIKTKYYSTFGDLFDETIEHDLEYLKQVTLPRKSTDDYLKDISKELSELTRLMKKAQGLNSFLVESPDQYSSRLKTVQNRHDKHKGIHKLLRDFFGWIHSKLNCD